VSPIAPPLALHTNGPAARAGIIARMKNNTVFLVMMDFALQKYSTSVMFIVPAEKK
jgi:hypothetical protein